MKIIVENCVEIVTHDKCAKCEKGYFLDSKGFCIKNPEENMS